tara:strand:+ start:16626 stop:17843 length:1218 start_codon:yes stop_codon:yes gene_type:complete
MGNVYDQITAFAGGEGLDLSSFEEALKEHYKGGVVEDLVYKNRPLMAMMPKYSKFGGRVLPVPVMNANPQNRSANFSDAQKTGGAYQAGSIKSFLLQRVRDYSIARIDGETLEASKGDANAFMQAATAEIDGAMSAIGRSLAGACYRDGSGVIGNAASVAAGPPIEITLTNPENVTQFEVGMILQDPTAAREGTVQAVDRSNGKLEMAAGSTLIATDDLVVKGDQSAKVSGLSSWITDTSLGTSFFGVDRSVDPSRLAGLKHDGSAQPIEEALIDGASLVGREGGRPDHCFMGFEKFSELVKALGSKVTYVDAKSPAGLGFKALELHAPYGTMKVIPDADCQPDTAWLLQMDTWSLNSLGECPRILTHDGNKSLRISDADAIEVRIGYYANIACKAPGWNCKVTL